MCAKERECTNLALQVRHVGPKIVLRGPRSFAEKEEHEFLGNESEISS